MRGARKRVTATDGRQRPPQAQEAGHDRGEQRPVREARGGGGSRRKPCGNGVCRSTVTVPQMVTTNSSRDRSDRTCDRVLRQIEAQPRASPEQPMTKTAMTATSSSSESALLGPIQP
jgi:hypothetical protein